MSAEKSRRLTGFFACVLAAAAVWLGLLPFVGRQTAVRAHIERLEAANINPSAMYYTELEMMGEVRESMRSFHTRHPLGLWSGRLSNNPETSPMPSQHPMPPSPRGSSPRTECTSSEHPRRTRD